MSEEVDSSVSITTVAAIAPAEQSQLLIPGHVKYPFEDYFRCLGNSKEVK